MKYRLAEIASIARGGRLVGENVEVRSVMTDSRHSFAPDSAPMFVAIAGVIHDGHNFIDDLYRRGVRAFMVEREVDAEAYPEAGFVVVPRSLRALQSLAANYRSHFDGVMVAVTGSTGKTAVKEWIAESAPEGVRVFRSPRSYNSQLGVALSLLMMDGSEDIAVIEAGISRPDEMARLEAIIRPDVGIFTSLGEQHDENFIDRAHKAAEKATLFARTRKVIYNSTNRHIIEALAAVKNKTGVESMRAMVGELYATLGYDREKVEERLAHSEPVRLQLSLSEGLGGSVVLSDTHNSDINSLSIALESLREVAGDRRRVVILSDVLYSALSDEEIYQRVARTLEAAGVDKTIGVGRFITAHKHLFADTDEFYSSTDEFLKVLTQDRFESSAILIKGGPMSGFDRIVHSLSRQCHTTVLEVNLSAMVANLNRYRARLRAGTKLMAMVKASSYGHGDYEIAAVLQHEGVDYLAVAFADEGVTLRQKGITMPIVVLNADADSFALMTSYRLEPEIYNFSSLEAFAAAVERAGESDYPIHIKIDSGMHRLGFVLEDVERLQERLRSLRSLLTVRSMFSHFATADMPEERAFVRLQQSRFKEITEQIISSLPYKPLRHINNTAGMEFFEDSTYDMCRLGIGLYGVGEGVKPISRLTTRIVQIKSLSEGETVGYGRAGKILRPTRTATIPIGYADGLDRRLGVGEWSVSVGGKRAPIVGRVCMDSCMIDVTDIECKEGDEVVVFGGEGGSVVEMASKLGTIPYEVMTSISTRVKRIYVKE
jgi:alanine racemase